MWEVRTTPEFEAALQDFLPNLARAGQFMYGVRWALERNPRQGVPGDAAEKIWYYTSPSNVSEVGDLAVFYTFNEAEMKVFLLGVKQATQGDV
jgi:hypothetical protein